MAASFPVSSAARSWSRFTVGSSSYQSSPTSASAMARRMAGDGVSAGPVDAAIVCVKTYDNDSAAKSMHGAIADSTILCSLQNGVDNEVFYGDLFPQATVIAATTRIVAWLEEPGVVVQRGP